MIGSPAIGGFIAFWGFWILLALAWLREELRVPGIAMFFLLWLVGYVGLRYVPLIGSLFTSYVACLDIALVLVIFKSDVRLT
jgi:hypothetical protein